MGILDALNDVAAKALREVREVVEDEPRQHNEETAYVLRDVTPDNDVARAAENGDLEKIKLTDGQFHTAYAQEDQMLALGHLKRYKDGDPPDYDIPNDFVRDFVGGSRDAHIVKGKSDNVSPADGHPMFYGEQQNQSQRDETSKGLFGSRHNPMYTVDAPANVGITGNMTTTGQPAKLVGGNDNRAAITIMNSSAAGNVFFGFTPGSVQLSNNLPLTGFVLGPGQSITLGVASDIYVTGTSSAIASFIETTRVLP